MQLRELPHGLAGLSDQFRALIVESVLSGAGIIFHGSTEGWSPSDVRIVVETLQLIVTTKGRFMVSCVYPYDVASPVVAIFKADVLTILALG